MLGFGAYIFLSPLFAQSVNRVVYCQNSERAARRNLSGNFRADEVPGSLLSRFGPHFPNLLCGLDSPLRFQTSKP